MEYSNITDIHFAEIQRRAIEHLGTPLMIRGGPGTGKTAVVTERARWLIANRHVSAFGTLVVAFGNRAARELASRLRTLLPPEAVAKLHIKTISGFCLQLLSTYGDLVGYEIGSKRLRVIHDEESREVLGRALHNVAASGAEVRNRLLHETVKRLSVDVIAPMIANAKHNGIGPDEYSGQRPDPVEQLIASIYKNYQAELQRMNVVDYGDLILKALDLLDNHAEPRDFVQEVFTNILIDEFQDVSFAEWRILQHLFGEPALVTVAGDPDQSVHAWRNAMGAQCFQKFRERFLDAELIVLNENHRSTPHIVAVSGCLIADERRQVALKKSGPPVVLLRACSEHEEVSLVASAIYALVRSGLADYSECAVMCRTNAQVDELEEALVRASVPYCVAGRGTFFQRPEIRHILAYLAIALDAWDDYAIRQVARLHFTKHDIEVLKGDEPELRSDHLTGERADAAQTLVDKIIQFNLLVVQLVELAAAHVSPVEAINRIVEWTHDGARDDRGMERIALLKSLAEPFQTIQDFLLEVESWNGEDPTEPTLREQVTVMTLLAAKGLEFKVSFLVGANEGTLPHYNSISPEELAEERRLMYVGLTRGEELSIVTYARERQGCPVEPSRFMRSWPRESVVRVDRAEAIDFLANLREREPA